MDGTNVTVRALIYVMMDVGSPYGDASALHTMVVSTTS